MEWWDELNLLAVEELEVGCVSGSAEGARPIRFFYRNDPLPI